ncbi:MAG: aspartate aminotransferase family protein [Candidatus Verstraetearchaeota archaeon]|nr:aspartate aminotransferase family protein [Candidatus Verstraetearchaeota archaeon]
MDGGEGRTGDILKRHLIGVWWRQRGWDAPVEIVDAEGAFLFEASGRRVLDFSSQLMCSNLGHKNRAVIESIVRQARKIPYASPAFALEVRAEAIKSLLGIMPKGIEKFFFTTSGSEANEAAVSIVRSYQRPRGAYKIISRYASYHGSTAAAASCTGDPRRWRAEPAGRIPGIVFAPDCYCYRCPFRLEYPGCGIACAEYVKYILENEGNVAGVIVEPIVGTNGVIVPVDEYMPRLKSIAEENGALLITDEVMCGWGRTGAWFAFEHWGIVPDLVTTAKGSTGAYSPLGITAVRRDVAEKVEEMGFAHSHTYEAHPLALAPLSTVISEYRRLNLLAHVREMDRYLNRRLNELKERHPSVGDIRGRGLFWAIELVKDRKTLLPFNTRAEKVSGQSMMVDKITAEMYRLGVYLHGWINNLVIAPPLIVGKEEIDLGIDALDAALKISDQKARG